MKRKVLIIGIDGGDWKFLNRVEQFARLDNLKKLKKAGRSGILRSTIPAITPAAWSSFQTGKNPGQTGIYDFSYWDLKAREKKLVNSQKLPPTLWQKLSKKGKGVGLVNLPLTYPPYKVNGAMVSGILTSSLKSDFTYPKKLKEKLLKKIPDYHIFNLTTIKNGNPHKNTKGFISDMKDIIKVRYQASRYLLANNQFDLFMVHFQATDVVQHVMWDYLDKEGADFDKKKAKLIAGFYSYLDKLIGFLIDDFKKSQKVEPLVIVLSDHGFEKHKKRFNLGWWLAQNGYLTINKGFYRGKLTSKLMKKLGEEQSNYFVWEKSSAFATGRSGEGFIYLLDKSIKGDLVDKLYDLEDDETSQKVIKRVWDREELYTGSKVSLLPHLIIEPFSGYSCSSTIRERQLFHNVNKQDDFHLGKHRQEGMVISHRPGQNSSEKELEANIVDICPAISYYLKVISKSNKKINNIL